MDMPNDSPDYRPMPKRPGKPPNPFKRQFRLLYVGQWIRALHKRPIDVVRATGINEGYLSELINGRKKNPSGHTLAQIADYLEIPMSYFYRPPPASETLNQLSDLDSAVLNRLRQSNN